MAESKAETKGQDPGLANVAGEDADGGFEQDTATSAGSSSMWRATC